MVEKQSLKIVKCFAKNVTEEKATSKINSTTSNRNSNSNYNAIL